MSGTPVFVRVEAPTTGRGGCSRMTVSPTATAAGEERGRVCRSEERGQRRCSHSRRRCGAGPGAGQQKLTDVSRPPVYVPACSGLSRNSAAPASQQRNTRARRRGTGGCCVEPPRPSRRGPTSHMADMVADSLCSSVVNRFVGRWTLDPRDVFDEICIIYKIKGKL